MTPKVRVRFAPAPTGLLHIGNARTALFNFLFARRHQGTLVLRIEDTDLERSNDPSVDRLMEDLQWLGIFWDEGPDRDGSAGPYRQSQRISIYREFADRFFKREKAISVSAPKRGWKNLEKISSRKEGCPAMTEGVAPSLPKRFSKWNRLVSSRFSDFTWEEDRSSLKTSSMER